ncbi:MAG: ABC-three component system middle component 5 [Cyclobacteriaceae bacterium]
MDKIDGRIEIEKIRILDFYLVFPSELLEIKTFRGFRKYSKYLNEEVNKYERVINTKRLFYKMESIQLDAIKGLISYGIMDSESFKNGRLDRTDKQLSEELQNQIHEANTNKMNLISLLTGPLASIDLYGRLGLKERTKLLEFKYDAV